MSIAAAWISGALYLIFILRAAPGWVRCFTGQTQGMTRPDPFESREMRKVMLLLTGTLVLRTATVCAIRLLSGKNLYLADTFRMYSGLDSRHYLDIARAGYTQLSDAGENLDLVFLPGYPLATGMLMMLIPDEALCGYLAAWIPFLAGGAVLYRMIRLDSEKQKALRTMALFCLFPAAVFFAYPMSESLFLLAATASLYAGRTRRWFAAGVFGFWAAFTRSVGVLMIVPLGAELIAQTSRRGWKNGGWRALFRNGLWLLMIPGATAVYLYINYAVKGDPLIFLQYQKSNWHQQPGWFFLTAKTQTEYAIRTWTEEPTKFWGLWMPNLLTGLVSLIWMGAAAKKIRPAYTVWFAVYFAVCYGTSWLLSGPRYMTVFFPLAMAADEMPGPRWLRFLMLGTAATGYTVCFGMRWGVW